MMKRGWAALLMVVGCLCVASPAFAKDDRVSIASDITVEEGSSSGDLVCVLCSVKLHGDVHGDVVTVLGSVTVDDGQAISGDIATVGGNVSLSDGARVNGDVAVVGGFLNRGPGATIGGESNVETGRGWLLVPFAPLLILIGIVWLVICLVRRRRYGYAMYPHGRRL